jgi:hypothetical protein
MSRESFSPDPLISVSGTGAAALAEAIGVETTELLSRLDASGGLVGVSADPRSCGVDC